MPIKARVTVFEPDSLAIVTNELDSELEQGRDSDLICYYRDLIKLKVPIRHRRCPEERRHNSKSFRLWKCWMEQQIAAIFEIAEVQAQRAAVRNRCANGVFSVALI